MATAKESSEFMTYFCWRYKQDHGKTYKLNRNTAKWAARDIIDSFGVEDCKTALEWAYRVKTEPFTWEWYAANVEKLLKASEAANADLAQRIERRRMAKEWLTN